MAVKKAKGERVGRIPYGFKLGADGVHLERDAAEQATIETVRAMRADGSTLAAIATALQERGIEPREGGRWYPMRVSRVLEAADSMVTP